MRLGYSFPLEISETFFRKTGMWLKTTRTVSTSQHLWGMKYFEDLHSK